MKDDINARAERSRRAWFAVTTWNADRQEKLVSVNRINGHIIGLTIRLPDGQPGGGKTSHHSLSIGRYRQHSGGKP